MLGWAAERDHDLLATMEIALQRAGYGVHVPVHPGVQAARSRDQLNGAIMVNYWHESLVQLDRDLSQLLNMEMEGESHA